MPNTLISITSAQTLPNVLFIKQFGTFNRYVFVTSKLMERQGRTDAVLKNCGVDTKAELVIADAESLSAVTTALADINFTADEKITVHLTGGTKMMALGVYNQITNVSQNVEVYYKPIDRDIFLQIYPYSKEVPVTVQLNLQEYLNAYGIINEEESKLAGKKKFIVLAEKLMSQIRRGSTPLEILKAATESYRGVDKKFLTGEWLELWLAHRIKKEFALSEAQISYNVKLKRGAAESNENTEYDVLYVRNNRLYVAECKYFNRGNFTKSKISKDWYKLGGLQLHMGLYATPFLVTANRFPTGVEKSLKESYKLFRIKAYADIKTIGSDKKLKSFLNKL